ncbi:ComF family protein [Phormidium pseudopriestleyi FRX01]|uniref:ComF family protein n=1 Tax=Phormidium pseudopriestleyi FRX01 TaxID=1759528 RepID=A0ABS3FTL9_9CYAN|nr:ComF family protein [Phormidium pseudopriestleyi]MBO0350123.1 ComF family protein [Phormidium pseudopriestleyi FRX01]
MMGNWSAMVKGWVSLFLKPNCPLCDRPGKPLLCPNCDRLLQRQKFSLRQPLLKETPPVLIWGRYGGVMKRAIAVMKYQNCPELARPLGYNLAETWLQSPLAKAQGLTVVPIPMYLGKQQKRGFNQAELLAKSFCELTGYPLEPRGLERVVDTEALNKLSPAERRQTLANSMTVGAGFRRSKPKQGVILLDDIYTTGATCREAIKTLSQEGIAVYGIAAIATTQPLD